MKRFFIFLLLASGCAYSVPSIQQEEVGLASWYGEPFHGRQTSNGETYDMYGLTAAHRTLPFGTVLEVTNLKTGRSVNVRVNDRGPFVRGRILDLSYGAALVLDTVGQGVAEVALKIVEVGEDTKSRFIIQVGSFSDVQNAYRVKQYLEEYHDNNVYIETVETNRGSFHRVRVGPFKSSAQAHRVMRSLTSKDTRLGKLAMVVVREH